MLTGSNLRKEMLRQNIPVYDRKTKRFDQPYAVGDCAGEGVCVPMCFCRVTTHLHVHTHIHTHARTHTHTGLCGTCLVQVLEGKEFLNKPDGVEAMVSQGFINRSIY